METIVFFTNKSSIRGFLNNLEVNWELSYKKFDKVVVPENKEFIFIFDDYNNREKEIMTDSYKNLIDELIREVKNNAIYIIHHSAPNKTIVDYFKGNLKSSKNFVDYRQHTHLNQITYQKIRRIHENLNNKEVLLTIFEEIKKGFCGDTVLEAKLDYLHNLLGEESFNNKDYLKIGLKENDVNEINKIIENFSVLGRDSKPIGGEKGCFNPNYVRALKDIRDVVLKY